MSDIAQQLRGQADVLDSIARRALESGGEIDPDTSQVIMRRGADEIARLRANSAKTKARHKKLLAGVYENHDANMNIACLAGMEEAAGILAQRVSELDECTVPECYRPMAAYVRRQLLNAEAAIRAAMKAKP